MSTRGKTVIHPTALKDAARQKLWAAESRIAWMRVAVIALNSITYFFLPDTLVKESLAFSIIALATIYCLLYALTRPYRKFPLLTTSYFTSVTDTVLIALWIYATGNFESPYYLLWFLSIIAVAYRYQLRETLFASVLYGATYIAITLLDQKPEIISELLIRCSYILLCGITAAFISTSALENIRDKIELAASEEKLRQFNIELEAKIADRTRGITASNEQLTREIEHRKQIEEKHLQLLHQLEHSNESLNSFAYVVSHDLKAPLRAISTLCDWIIADLECKCSEEEREKLHLLKDRVNKMRLLIDGILRLSRAGNAPLEIQEIDPREIVSEIMQMVGDVNTNAVIIREPIPRVHFDRTAFFQIMENLIGNAIKYAGGSNKAIEVRGENRQGDVIISVADQGPGISKDRHESIFNIFNGQQGAKDSTGIGLAIVRKLVERVNGKVWVESHPGQGSVFHVLIPTNPVGHS